MSRQSESRGGLIVLLLKLGAKFGGKLLSLLAKLAKVVKVGKVGLAGASFASYAFLYTWQFAAIIMAMLFIHESGHIWAMKKSGVKTKGIYFLPFVGGAAVAEEAFPTRGAEVYIALMGPIWGLALSLAAAALYVYYPTPAIAAAASWMAMVNLFNLLPVTPLDGGRVLKSITLSIGTTVGLWFMGISVLVSLVLLVELKLALFSILLIVGTLEFMSEYRKRKNLIQLRPVAALEGLNTEYFQPNAYEQGLLIPTMNSTQIALSAIGYITVAAVLYGIMYSMQHVPGAAAALKVFTD